MSRGLGAESLQYAAVSPLEDGEKAQTLKEEEYRMRGKVP
jgi:hypothetical protein